MIWIELGGRIGLGWFELDKIGWIICTRIKLDGLDLLGGLDRI